MTSEFGKVANPSIILSNGETAQYSVPAPTVSTEPSLAITAQGKFVTLYADHLAVWNLGDDNGIGLKNLATFPPARNATTVEAGDVDGDGTDEIVVATLGGRVAWFELDELTTDGLDLGIPRNVQIVSGQVYDHRLNPAISATWGFAAKPGSSPELHGIDVSGGWWTVDPLNGQPIMFPPRTTFVLDTAPATAPLGLGVRGLAYGGPQSSTFSTPASGGAHDSFWQVDGNPLWATSRLIRTTPYLPTTPDYSVWGFVTSFDSAISWDDFWLFRMGGAAVDTGSGQWRVAWWRTGTFPNLVQQLSYTLQGTPAPTSLWSSTGFGLGGPPPGPTKIGAAWPDSGVSLRTSIGPLEAMNLQCVQIGKVIPGEQTLHTVVATSGGRVIVLDGNNGHIRGQSEDLGFGGMALALKDLDGDGFDEIVFAPAVAPIDATPPPSPYTSSGWMRSYVHVLRFATSPDRIVRVTTQPVGDPYSTSHDLHGYGACGIAIADLIVVSDGVPEIIVTTLNGELVVFEQTAGVLSPAPLFRTIVEGQLGAFNSIVVGDLDPIFNLAKPEIYIASTTGIRKFYVQ